MTMRERGEASGLLRFNDWLNRVELKRKEGRREKTLERPYEKREGR